MVYLIGIGMGTDATITSGALNIIEKADLIIGARRLLDVPAVAFRDVTKVPEYMSDKIAQIIEESDADSIAIILSGDSSFYSGALKLQEALKESNHDIEIVPGISSYSYMCSRVGFAMQDVEPFSAHGRECDPVRAVMGGKKAFFLTGGDDTPANICRQLSDAGLGSLKVYVGERLSYPNENITDDIADNIKDMEFEPLAVMIAEAAAIYNRKTPGIPDTEFVRGKVPMTKRAVRMSAVSMMDITDSDICWDIGAGTGSVSIEMALFARRVYSVEKNVEAVSLLHQNKEKFCRYNMVVVPGDAEEVIDDLPAPDKIFIGGSSGKIAEILDAAESAKTVCITAVTIETIENAVRELETRDFETDIMQIQASNIIKRGKYHMFDAENPVFIVLGRK